MNRGDAHGDFEARLMIDLDHVQAEVWSYELLPVNDSGHCGTAEWVLDHFRCCSRDDFLHIFDLNPSKCW
ncbi:hypothetical protein M0R72_14665 [Candidatus Pacearchaeota archaeon]|jgi:hypothetical protein|nr:hypothetical protein [Candidatus Pacearchaeota archaeon]